MATTCLTVAAGSMAMAGTYTGPYGSSGTPGTAPDVGLDSPITGTATLNGHSEQWFEIEGLPGGVSLASLMTIQDVSGDPLGYTLEDDLGNVLLGPTGLSAPNFATLSGNTPADGNVVVEIAATNEAPSNWQVTVNVSAPEPGTVAAVGIGLLGLGALGLRRRRSS